MSDERPAWKVMLGAYGFSLARRGIPVEEAIAALRETMDRVARGEIKVEGMEADPKLGEAIAAGNAQWRGRSMPTDILADYEAGVQSIVEQSGDPKVPGPEDTFDLAAVLARAPKDADMEDALRSGRASLSYSRVEIAEREVAKQALLRELGAAPPAYDGKQRPISFNHAVIFPDGRVELAFTPPKADHPAPWRWNGYASMHADDVGESLLDANGKPILTADCDGEPMGRVRALTEAAPLLHELLLKAQWSGGDPEGSNRDVCPACSGVSRAFGGEGHAAACRIGLVLAQVEERSRG